MRRQKLPKKRRGRPTITVRLDKKTLELLRAHAERLKITVGALVRGLLEVAMSQTPEGEKFRRMLGIEEDQLPLPFDSRPGVLHVLVKPVEEGRSGRGRGRKGGAPP